MSKPIVLLENICQSYVEGRDTVHVVLDDISLKINPGEFVTMMGNSGTGKSTLLNIIGCLATPSSGHYELNGLNIDHKTDVQLAEVRAKTIGYVFQSFNLLNYRTVLDNVCLPLLYNGWHIEDAREQAHLYLEEVGLRGFDQRTPKELSGGQQGRVAIARSLVNHPQILLADEPTGNLDSETTSMIMNLLLKVRELHNITLLVVTHDKEISEYGERMIIIEAGKIAYDGVVQ